jgi:pimeloyl-ACP methyl ester carboxylesterase
MLPARLPLPIDTRRLRSFDGTQIAYHVTGSPYLGAPWVVLAGGLAGGPEVFRGQIDYLGDRYRFVSWDYRGLYGSERPRSGAYAVADHVRDLEAVLAAERIDHAGFIGWSAGVQVVLEASLRLRGRAHSLVLLDGVGGRPLDPLVPIPAVRAVVLPFLGIVRRARSLGRSRPRIGRRDAALWLARLRLVGPSADEAARTELEAALGRLDLDAFLRNLEAFGVHDAQAALPAVDVPALIIAGDHDPVVPRGIAQQMARSIPHAELMVVRGGAHCIPIEYPELVGLRVERFYRDHGL